jgi:transcription termination factor Rho
LSEFTIDPKNTIEWMFLFRKILDYLTHYEAESAFIGQLQGFWTNQNILE